MKGTHVYTSELSQHVAEGARHIAVHPFDYVALLPTALLLPSGGAVEGGTSIMDLHRP